MTIELNTLFFSRRPRRLRAGWRILTQSVVELFIYIFLTLIFFRNISSASQSSFVFDRLIFSAATTLSIYLARHYLDRHSFTSLGLDLKTRNIWHIVIGFFLAGLLIAGIYTFEYQMGWVTFMGYRWDKESIGTMIVESMTSFLILSLCPAWQDELTYRGYWLQNVKQGLNIALAILFTTITFALRHLGNPNSSYLSMIGIFMAGLWLVYAWFVTQQLWLPLGIHAGWNFFSGVVFGFPVRGFNSFHWIEHTMSGPAWMTGGEFGPEAGLVGMVAIGMGTLLLFVWHRWYKVAIQTVNRLLLKS